MPPARSHDEYTLSIRLAEIEPAIWRREVGAAEVLVKDFLREGVPGSAVEQDLQGHGSRTHDVSGPK